MKGHDFWVVIYPTKDVTLRDLQTECRQDNWAPVLILRNGDRIVVPMFRDVKVCQAFIKRNLPVGEMVGFMGASEVDLKTYTDKGWEVEWLTHPKLYTNRPGWEIDAEAVESDFELTVHPTRNPHTVRAVNALRQAQFLKRR